MESMTGYADVEGVTNQFTFAITAKSLNSKYIEVYVNMPKVISSEELELTEITKKYINRGKVELNVDIIEWKKSREIDIDTDLLTKYSNQLSKVEKRIDDKKSFSLDTLLSFDGVIKRERTVVSDQSKKNLAKACHKVLKSLVQMRKKEGESVKKDLLLSVSSIKKNVEKIKKLSKDVSEQQFKKLKERIEKITKEKVDDLRLYTEIGILADKQDINEEISRLTDHFKKFNSVIKEKGQTGKKLDFLAQELFREINTIASKANNSQVAHLCVEVKNYIDKIREQSRNII